MVKGETSISWMCCSVTGALVAQFPASRCGAVPKGCSHRCVSEDILVGTWETDTTPLVRPN